LLAAKGSDVQLVVGLGNPGSEYAVTRHNLGFRVLDELAERCGLSFRLQKGRYLWAEGETELGPLVLLKPLTYMNRSGEALRAWSARNGVSVTGTGADEGLSPIVVCDDLALPLGSLRIRGRGSAGGQKGLESLIRVMGGEHFPRVRLGIAGGREPIPPEDWSDYVLEPFAPAEMEIVAELIPYAAEAVICLLAQGTYEAANRFNRRLERPVE
jgi:PTH1 family peptidyl-tRNA hydrolase